MPSYILPQVLVYQEFKRSPVAISQPLNACNIGEQFDLHRYAEPTEKDIIKVSDAYDPASEVCFEFPGRQAGGIVDPGYTKVFLDDALLRYYQDAAGSGSTVEYTTPNKNRIRAASVIWKSGNGYDRSGALLRDVKAGDVVRLTGVACGHSLAFQSSVIGFIPETIAADIEDSASDAHNAGTQSLAKTNTQTAGTTNNVGLANGDIDASTYNGLPTGDINDVYTVEVVAGGGNGSAQLRITSQSGNDDQGVVDFDVDFASYFPVGTRGLQVKFRLGSPVSSVTNDVFLVGQTWSIHVSQAYTKLTTTSSGTYLGTKDTTYVVEVTRGGKSGAAANGDKPQISVSTTTGVDVSGPTLITGTGAFPVGSQGVNIAFAQTSLSKGDRFTILVTAAHDGAFQTLVLAQNLPPELRGECNEGTSSSSSVPAPDLSISLYIKKNIQVPANGADSFVNWTQNDTQVCMQSGVVAYDSSWASSGVELPLPVEGGKVYVEHRDRIEENAITVGTISDVGDIPTIFASAPVVHPDNPLVFATYKSLLNANGEDVKFLALKSATSVAALDLDDWLSALETLVNRDDVYSLVPLTQDKDVLDAVLAHCDSQSAPTNGRWRICWLNRPAVETEGIYVQDDNGDPLLAQILDDPDAEGTQYTMVEVSEGKFVTNGVRPKDTVRANYTTDGFGNLTYSTYIVDRVVNEDTLLLIRGANAPVNVPSKIEIYRTPTKTELATTLATYPGLFKDRRAALVWPDKVGNAGQTFAGYFLCSGLAGLRSGVLPHQGLTNVELLGYDDLTRSTTFFSANQLNLMAASGYWIVTQDTKDGTVFTRHQLTCGDQTDINQREQSVTTNLDSISFLYLNRLKVYIGKGNVTPTMINIIQGEVLSLIESLKNTILSDRLGPQVIDATIVQLAPDPLAADHIILRVENNLPKPFNNADTHLIVS